MIREKQVYIETFGCQMNERDSEIMAQKLREADYITITDPAKADLVVVNTCSIREKAEQKAYSLLGRLKRMKVKRPEMVIAVAGCVAQQDGERMLERMPFVDIVVGPQRIYQLPLLVDSVRLKRKPEVSTELSSDFSIPSFLTTIDENCSYKKFVTIMQGCNNFCTYCIVPYTRGREISRPMEDILAEISSLVEQGVKEVTLLGQNVNSYGQSLVNGQQHTFPELLRAVSEIPGLERLRFTTSHPKDLSEELMQCFAEIDSLCPHFHLPVQSGSDRILKRMNRKYTIKSYLEKVDGLRRYRPDIAITTDIIVGFPGETGDDFEATMDLIETVRYHGAFSFKYSDRPNTKSSQFPDKVPDDVKSERLTRLQARQEEISLEKNEEDVGKRFSVMVEGESKNAAGQWSGRTDTNQIVNFDCDSQLHPGQMLDVLIEAACKNSLRGKLIS